MKLNVNGQMSNVSEKGYSLLELVVVLAIFLIIIGVTVDLFLSVVKSQRRILEEQELLNQTSHAMEYMSTAIRNAKKDDSGSCVGTAGNFYLLTHCPNGTLVACNGIKFINQSDNDACVEFFLDSALDPIDPPLRELKTGGTAQNLLSSKFKILHGNFIINSDKALHVSSSLDPVQPKVTVLLSVQTKSVGNQQQKIIQTTISQKNLNAVFPPPGLSCNGSHQCVTGGGGISCSIDTDCL